MELGVLRPEQKKAPQPSPSAPEDSKQPKGSKPPKKSRSKASQPKAQRIRESIPTNPKQTAIPLVAQSSSRLAQPIAGPMPTTPERKSVASKQVERPAT
ncbi:hypothetical protein C0993_004584, partial [Termitomyces sp. T159_Od127]